MLTHRSGSSIRNYLTATVPLLGMKDENTEIPNSFNKVQMFIEMND